MVLLYMFLGFIAGCVVAFIGYCFGFMHGGEEEQRRRENKEQAVDKLADAYLERILGKVRKDDSFPTEL